MQLCDGIEQTLINLHWKGPEERSGSKRATLATMRDTKSTARFLYGKATDALAT